MQHYQNFYAKDLLICIFIIFDGLVYNIDILDIIHFIIYSYYLNKSLNMILQQFG